MAVAQAELVFWMAGLETSFEVSCTAVDLMAVSLAELVFWMTGLETGVEIPTIITP